MPKYYLAVLALTASALVGQGTDLGAIRGVITDPTGSTVPDATVTISDVATNAVITVKTNSAGDYEANSLRSGDYKISVDATGFRTVEISRVTLRSGTGARADARLEIAHTGESVTVQAEAPLIETDLPTISGADQYVYDVNIDRGATRSRVPGREFKWGHRVIHDPADEAKIYIATYGGSVWHGPAQ